MSMTWSNFAGFEYSVLMMHVTDFSEYRSYSCREKAVSGCDSGTKEKTYCGNGSSVSRQGEDIVLHGGVGGIGVARYKGNPGGSTWGRGA